MRISLPKSPEFLKGPSGHLSSGYWSFVLGVKQAGREVDHLDPIGVLPVLALCVSSRWGKDNFTPFAFMFITLTFNTTYAI